MSEATVRAFWQKVKTDPALQKQLDAIPHGPKETAAPAVIRVAAAAGFAFSAEEYEAAVEEELARRHAARELSEEELARVAGAGGKSFGRALC